MVISGSDQYELPEMQEMIDGKLQEYLFEISIGIGIGLGINKNKDIILIRPAYKKLHKKHGNFM